MIQTTDDPHHRVLALHVPRRRNALSKAVLGELADGIRATDRTVILTGSDDIFSAGADLGDLTGTEKDLDVDAAVTDVVHAVDETRVPVLAAVHGYCLGAAVEVAAACDIVVASPSATFGVPATRLGLLYNPAGLQRLARRVPVGAMARLLLSGERVSGEDARQMGLVDLVAESPLDAAVGLATRIAGNDPEAVLATRAVLRQLRTRTFDPDEWESERRRLLTTQRRRDALAAARNR